MNKVLLLGNLTRDPELRKTSSGISVARFTVACQRKYKNEQGKYDADFVDCTAWRERAEFVSKWFSKGSPIAVEGTIRTSRYEKNGETRFGYTVAADNIEFTGSKNGSKSGEQSSSPKPAAKTGPRSDDSYDDEIYGDDLDQNFVPLDDSELPF